jgi:DNA-directed RNA polymerase subunit RPC12/RpoP
MAIFPCPRCLEGVMDSRRGVLTQCWYCSSKEPCYACDRCGAKFCATCLEKIQKSRSVTSPGYEPPPIEEDAL